VRGYLHRLLKGEKIMFLDQQLVLSDSQSVIGTAATAYPSTNAIDQRAAGSDLGSGEPLYLAVNVNTTVVGGSGGIKLDLIQSANSDLSSPDVLASVTTPATPIAGTVLWQIAIPQTTKRYVGIQFTPLTSNTTAGAITAAMVKNIQGYPT
jgi:hypothetical protein